MPCTGGSLQLRARTWISRIAGRFITAEPPGKPRLGWDWNQICHLTEKQILHSPRKELVSCKLLLLEATLNLKLCLPFQTLPALSPSSISAFAGGKWKFSGKWVSHSQTAKQPPRNSMGPGPSNSPVKGLIPKVADHEGLSSPRLLWGQHPGSHCPLYLF